MSWFYAFFKKRNISHFESGQVTLSILIFASIFLKIIITSFFAPFFVYNFVSSESLYLSIDILNIEYILL